MRRFAGAPIAVAMFIVLFPRPVASHESVTRHSDPQGDALVDIWTTSRTTIHVARQHHRVGIRVHGDLYADWSLVVFVDSRRGHRPDFKLWAYQDLGMSDCGARRLFGPKIEVRCDPGGSYETTVWWSTRRKLLDPDKRIRWRAVTDYPGEEPDEVDHAPDSGWYV